MPKDSIQRFDKAAATAALPARDRATHKKKASVLIIAGSAQYLGASLLCGRAAYRSGAGLVHLALPGPLALSAMAALPELVVHGLGKGAQLDHSHLKAIHGLAAPVQAVAVGPGLGRAPGTQRLVRSLWKSLPKRSVFDADALAALDLKIEPGAERVLTPHEGELALLLGDQALALGRPTAARSLASLGHCVAVLKGPGTLVANLNGALSLNSTGSSVLATAGTGDVLTGAIAALMAQGASPYDAARLGVWAHGIAAELWARDHAGRGLLASDLADGLPGAFALAGA